MSAIVAFGLVLLALLLAQPGGSAWAGPIGLGAQSLALCFGLAMCFWNGGGFGPLYLRTIREPDLRSWVPVTTAAGMIALLGASLIEVGYTLAVNRDVPLPYWDDVFNLGGYMLFLPTIWLLSDRGNSAGRRLGAIVDGSVIIFAIITLAWSSTLGPTLQRAVVGTWPKVVLSCYPVMSCLGLSFMVLVWLRTQDPSRKPALILFTMAGGLLFVSVTANIYYILLHGTYRTGDYWNAGWPVAFLLFGLTASVVRHQILVQDQSVPWNPGRTRAADQVPRLWRILLPYAPLPAVGVEVYATWRSSGSYVADGTIIGCLILVGLVMARQVLALMDNNRLTARLLAREAQLHHQALHDPLTDLPNRGALIAALNQALASARRFDRPCALLFLDLDHFKQVNDGFGHQAGDTVLRIFATLLRAHVRTMDTPGRWGGEEFVVILPETEKDTAVLIAERLRCAVAAYRFPVGAGLSVTCSIGIAAYPYDATTEDTLISRADAALYTAKLLGRNQVRHAAEPAVLSLEAGAAAVGIRDDP